MDKIKLTSYIKDIGLKNKMFKIIDKANGCLKNYDVRYKHNENVKLIFEHYEIIEGLHENYEEGCGPFDTPQYIKELGRIHSYVDRLIAIFLPKGTIKYFV